MKLEIRNTRDDKSQPINVVVYGDSGVGKTSLVKQLPSEETLVISAEGGLLSIKDHDVDYVSVKSVEDVLSILNQVAASKYKHVFIDSITELSQNHFTFLKAKYDQVEIDEKKKPGSMGIKVWGDFLEDFSKMFKTLRDMRKNVVAISLLKEKENEIGMVVKSPDIYGKSSDRIMAWFDEVFFMHMSKDGNRKFLTEKGAVTAAKDRSGKLEKIEDADIAMIIKKING
tara:strand:+ start:2104 stop:2787 length:684 start_codon:yes stop_codon:yes gene_type:complete